MTRLTLAALACPAIAAALLAAQPAAAAPDAITTQETAQGPALADAKGMTLYTFDMDKDGMSACYDQCAENWPPLLAAAGAMADGDYGLTQRKDGSMQWTYDGMPLYTWKNDAKPGDVTGDGVKGVWHIARPE